MNQSLIPYITVIGAARAIDFYKTVFGAEESGARYTEPNGRVGHAEIEIDGSKIMLSDEHPEIEVLSPQTLGGTPMTLYLSVGDAEAVVARAVAAGAKVRSAVEVKAYGDRSGTIEDPFGHRWMISTHVEDVSVVELQNRVGDTYKIS